MEDGRRNLQFIAVKTYYRPKELVEMLDATEKDIVRFAYGVGALYEAEGIKICKRDIQESSKALRCYKVLYYRFNDKGSIR